jgi:hypothetical protein
VIATVPASTGDVPDLGDVVCEHAVPTPEAEASTTSASP